MNQTQTRTFFQIIVGGMLALLAPTNLVAAEIEKWDTVYVIGSAASVRTAPSDNAPIAATLPIGTRLNYIGSPSRVASGPNKECKGADLQSDPKWSCLCATSFRVDYGVHWCGWVAKDLLAKDQPKLADLIAAHDKTPRDHFAERRKWAERAVAIAPLSVQAQERVLDVLATINDPKALESAKRSFDSYHTKQPRSSGTKFVFSFDHDYLEPIAEIKKGRLVFREFDQSTNYEFHSRGQFYNLYSAGKEVGTVVTHAEFNCRAQLCPKQTIARQALPDKTIQVSSGVATNFDLSLGDRTTRQISEHEKATLLTMANKWTDSSAMSPKAKKALRAHIRQKKSNPTFAIGALGRDGRVMLIGNWVMGSMNGQHYGDVDDIYESIFIIAEQQSDGTFRRATALESLASRGCYYFDHVDIDQDGVDEIFLKCEQLEGQYNYALAKRVDNKWQITYGSPRN